MKTVSQPRATSLACLALLGTPAGFATAAADDALAPYKDPDSSVTFGVGYLPDTSRWLSKFSGLSDQSTYGLGGFDIRLRDDTTGTWWNLNGRNIGLRTPEVMLSYDREGSWGFFVEYSAFDRREPLTIATGVTGLGTDRLTTGGPIVPVENFHIERDRFALGVSRELPSNFHVAVSFSQMEKQGARIFGRGTGQFLAEPLDASTEQMEAIVSFTGERLQVAGGYYGSVYRNVFRVLDVSTGTDISLPPDNDFHQLYVGGGFNLPRTARLTFKFATGRASQNDPFFTAPDFPGNTRTHLDGKVDTVLAQAGFTMRPIANLSLLANVRYEDRDDKTPRFQFLTASTGRDGFNTPLSRRSTVAKADVSYALPGDLRLTGGVDYDKRQRSVLPIRQASWREENDETTWRVELRRSLASTLSGAVMYARSDRGGSDYLPANNNAAADVIDPVHFADRDRRKLRASLDWAPVEWLSLQGLFDEYRDRYDGRPLGPETGKARFWSLDSAIALGDNWQLNAWWSRDQNRIVQSTITGANGTVILAQTWQANLFNESTATGLGVSGRIGERVRLGLDYQRERDDSEFRLTATIPAAAVLPDYDSRRTRTQAWLEFQLRERLDLRAEVIHDRFETTDWTWTGWVYADGTVIGLAPDDSGTFVGLSARYHLD